MGNILNSLSSQGLKWLERSLLKSTLCLLTTSAEFLTMKQHRDFVMFLSKEQLWDYLFSIACAFYLLVRIVCLADCHAPAMDKSK